MPELSVQLTFPVICSQCAETLEADAIGDMLICPKCGTKHLGRHVSAETREFAHTESDVSPDETFDVLESTSDLLRLRLKRLDRRLGTSVIVLMGLSLGTVWIGATLLVWNLIHGAKELSSLVIALSVGIAAFIGSLLALYVLRGEADIELTRERMTCRRRAGLSRSVRYVPTDTIESVRIVDAGAVVYGLQGMVPLTPEYSNACSQKVADILRNRLVDWGQLSADR